MDSAVMTRNVLNEDLFCIDGFLVGKHVFGVIAAWEEHDKENASVGYAGFASAIDIDLALDKLVRNVKTENDPKYTRALVAIIAYFNSLGD